MHENSSVFLQIAQKVWLYFVFLLLGIISRPSSAVVAPGLLDHTLFPEEVGAFQCAFFIGSFEDEAVSKIQGEDTGFLPTERRDERG